MPRGPVKNIWFCCHQHGCRLPTKNIYFLTPQTRMEVVLKSPWKISSDVPFTIVGTPQSLVKYSRWFRTYNWWKAPLSPTSQHDLVSTNFHFNHLFALSLYLCNHSDNLIICILKWKTWLMWRYFSKDILQWCNVINQLKCWQFSPGKI